MIYVLREDVKRRIHIRSIVYSHLCKQIIKMKMKKSHKNVPFPSQEQNLIIRPKRHNHTRTHIQRHRLNIPQPAHLPNPHLPITHPTKPRRSDLIQLPHPRHPRPLNPTMPITHPNRLTTSTGVENPEFPVSAGGRQQRSGGVKRHALNNVPMPTQHRPRLLRIGNVPQFDGAFAPTRRQHPFRTGMEQNLADLSRGPVDPKNGIEILRDPSLGAPPFERGRGHAPEHYFAVFACGGDEGVVVRGPVGVEDGGGVGACEGEGVGEFVGEGGGGVEGRGEG